MLHDGVIQAMAKAGYRLGSHGFGSFDGTIDDRGKRWSQGHHPFVETCKADGLEPEVSVLIGGSAAGKTYSVGWTAAFSDEVCPLFRRPPSLHHTTTPSNVAGLSMAISATIDNARGVVVNLPNLPLAKAAGRCWRGL